MTLKVNYEYWKQTPEELRQLAITSAHSRTRERYLALYEISLGKSANQISAQIKRRPETVTEWVHNYNKQGNDGVVYKRTGGRPPFFFMK